MEILGLNSGAQVIVLQGLSTYTALASAYFFVRPVLRGQTLQSHRDILSSIASTDQDVAQLINSANNTLTRRAQLDYPLAMKDNKFGIILLIASVILLTCAVTLQAYTDPAFARNSSDHAPCENVSPVP